MNLPASLALVLVLSAVLLPRPAAALTILLTNEDGWDALGLQTLKEALLAAGHLERLLPRLVNSLGGDLLPPPGLGKTREVSHIRCCDHDLFARLADQHCLSSQNHISIKRFIVGCWPSAFSSFRPKDSRLSHCCCHDGKVSKHFL